jgi:hypothetical protein
MSSRLYERACGAVMWLLVVAVMLATLFDPVSARTTGHRREAPAETQDDVVVKEIHIALIKNVLKLRAEQEPYWIPVENALRNLAQWQAAKAASTSALPPESRGAREYANLVMRRLKRIAAIAVPLRKSLDETQRHDLAILARIAGLEILLASR